MKAIDPILRDIDNRYDSFPQYTKEMLNNAFALLEKGIHVPYSMF